MLSHFLKVFYRTTFKNPSYSFINVAGLAVGFACSIFILLWIIGVRKVMGATVLGIVVMLCKDFIRLVALGILIGCPIGYYVGELFLSKYAFHAEIDVWIFLITAMSMILSTVLIVSYQSVKTALTNPVNVLRDE